MSLIRKTPLVRGLFFYINLYSGGAVKIASFEPGKPG